MLTRGALGAKRLLVDRLTSRALLRRFSGSLVSSRSVLQFCAFSTPCLHSRTAPLVKLIRKMSSDKLIDGQDGSHGAADAPAPAADRLNIFQVVELGRVHEIKVENIRNFSVIAHVDHGKSTLSDSILQYLGNISDKQRRKGQVLDTLQVERERGITVKAQTASMVYLDPRSGEQYLLNLIDTPGHVDFSYEVSRSLATCQGALLLVDACQGVQAQTISNYNKAAKLGLDLIPVITKIDLPTAMPEETALAFEAAFKIDPDSVIMTSAKRNIGIEQVVHAIVDKLPSPALALQQYTAKLSSSSSASSLGTFRGRIVDSWFDEHRGVVCLVQVVAGRLEEGQRVSTVAAVMDATNGDKTDFSVQEVGFLTPEPLRTHSLAVGHVGYVVSGMRSTRQAKIGDTMFVPAEQVSASDVPMSELYLPGHVTAKPMLFASIFPVEQADLEALFAAVDRLCLNDNSITVTKETSSALGSGLRCGFLGFLHMEVFNQRLHDEYNMNVVMTTPSVPYIVRSIDSSTSPPTISEKLISNISEWPDNVSRAGKSREVFEPMCRVTIISPNEFYGALLDVLKQRRAENMEVSYLDDGKTFTVVSLCPWQEIVVDMHDVVKNCSSGYASFDYEEAGYQKSDLVKVDIVVNNEVCDPLSFVSHQSTAAENGRALAVKLKEVISRQQFEIIIQARINTKVLARERIQPYRKDVLARSGKTVGGGDITRKKKLLEKQKEGKKRSKMIGKVEIGQEAFWAVLQR